MGSHSMTIRLVCVCVCVCLCVWVFVHLHLHALGGYAAGEAPLQLRTGCIHVHKSAHTHVLCVHACDILPWMPRPSITQMSSLAPQTSVLELPPKARETLYAPPECFESFVILRPSVPLVLAGSLDHKS